MADNMPLSLMTLHTTRVPDHKTERGRNETRLDQTRAKEEGREEREVTEATPSAEAAVSGPKGDMHQEIDRPQLVSTPHHAHILNPPPSPVSPAPHPALHCRVIMTDNRLPSLMTPHTTRTPDRKTEQERNETKPDQTRVKEDR